MASGLGLPVQIYPMFEIARRAVGPVVRRAPAGHRRAVVAVFSEVAADNPYAWSGRGSPPTRSRATATPDNRMIGFPYTKLMNSNNTVEQPRRCRRAPPSPPARGRPRDRWVFPGRARTGTTTGSSGPGRPALVAGDPCRWRSPCSPARHRRHRPRRPLLVLPVRGADRGRRARPRPRGRPLTVTGGMSFVGGPGNNYATHGRHDGGRLRDDPGSRRPVTANGGYVTKHASASTAPSHRRARSRRQTPQAEVDALPRGSGRGPRRRRHHREVHGDARPPWRARVASSPACSPTVAGVGQRARTGHRQGDDRRRPLRPRRDAALRRDARPVLTRVLSLCLLQLRRARRARRPTRCAPRRGAWARHRCSRPPSTGCRCTARRRARRAGCRRRPRPPRPRS